MKADATGEGSVKVTKSSDSRILTCLFINSWNRGQFWTDSDLLSFSDAKKNGLTICEPTLDSTNI